MSKKKTIEVGDVFGLLTVNIQDVMESIKARDES